jgi:Carboxypeptidase regulatory-like domain
LKFPGLLAYFIQDYRGTNVTRNVETGSFTFPARGSRVLFGWILAIVLVLMQGTIWAQGPTSGSINGIITDASGAAVNGVKVTVASPTLVVPQTLLTSGQGVYRFPSLPPGTYTLSAEAPGFQQIRREGIVLTVGFNATVDVGLAVEGQAQSVAVSAEAPLLDTENTKTQDTFSEEELKDIPTSRDMWSLIGIAPGFSLNRFDVGGSTAGTQTSYTSYGMGGQQRVQMDGVNMTESNNATSAYTDYSAFEEVQMGTSGNDASMPSPGVQINMIVKSGGNQFHGDFYQDYESSKFQGTNISSAQLLTGAGTGTRITSYHDTNGDFGGPIKKDKLWFFTSFRKQEIGTTITGYPVAAPGTGPPFNTILSNGTYKLTYQINANNKISQMLNFERKQQPYRNAASNQYQDAVYDQDLVEWIGSLEWSSTITSNLFLNVRLGSWGYNWTNTAYKNTAGVYGVRETDNTSGDVQGAFNPQRFSRRRFQIEPTMSYAANHLLGLSHFFTFGFLTEKETYNFEQYSYPGGYALTFASPSGAPDFTSPSQVTLYDTPAVTSDFLRHNGAYVQDKIKISKRLTVTAGIRWDYDNNWRPDETIRPDVTWAGFFFQGAPLPNGYSIAPTYPSLTVPGNKSVLKYPHAFAPRFGLAYDLFGNGRTTVKMGWGRYFENPGAVISNAVNPIRTLSYTFKWTDLNGDGKFTPNEMGAFQSSSGSAASPIDPNIRLPYMDDYNGFIEHELTHNFVIRAGFVYRKLSHDWALTELNRTANLYTNPVTATDPGPAGATPTPITVYDIPAGVTLPPSLQEYTTPNSNNSYFRNVELTATRRMTGKWSMTATFLGTWSDTPLNPTSAGVASNIIPTQPNLAQYNIAALYNENFRIFGTYKAPWGIVISPVYRYQLGAQFARELTVGGLRIGSLAVPLDPANSYRQNNIAIFDTRAEKQFSFKERFKVGIFFDAFNIGNSNADQNQDNFTGTKTITVSGTKVTYQRFLAPTTVISPRIFRLGAKFSF